MENKPISCIVVTLLVILGLTTKVNGARIKANTPAEHSANLGIAVLNYYETFQWAMRHGCPANNLPIMDPWKLPYIPFNQTKDSYSFVGNVSNIYVTGLSNFHLVGGNFDSKAQEYRMTFDVIMPEIKILGEYQVKASLLVGGFPVAWSGMGIMSTTLIDYRGVGEIKIKPLADNPNGLYISDLKLKFYLGDIAVNNWNDLWSIARNNYINKHLHDLVMLTVEELDWTAEYRKYILPLVNGQIGNMSMDQMIDMVDSFTGLYSKETCMTSTAN